MALFEITIVILLALVLALLFWWSQSPMPVQASSPKVHKQKTQKRCDQEKRTLIEEDINAALNRLEISSRKRPKCKHIKNDDDSEAAAETPKAENRTNSSNSNTAKRCPSDLELHKSDNGTDGIDRETRRRGIEEAIKEAILRIEAHITGDPEDQFQQTCAECEADKRKSEEDIEVIEGEAEFSDSEPAQEKNQNLEVKKSIEESISTALEKVEARLSLESETRPDLTCSEKINCNAKNKQKLNKKSDKIKVLKSKTRGRNIKPTAACAHTSCTCKGTRSEEKKAGKLQKNDTQAIKYLEKQQRKIDQVPVVDTPTDKKNGPCPKTGVCPESMHIVDSSMDQCECGRKLQRRCPVCNDIYSIWWDECSKCHKPLPPEAVLHKRDTHPQMLISRAEKLHPRIPEEATAKEGPCPCCWEPGQKSNQKECVECEITLPKSCIICKTCVMPWWHRCPNCETPNTFRPAQDAVDTWLKLPPERTSPPTNLKYDRSRGPCPEAGVCPDSNHIVSTALFKCACGRKLRKKCPQCKCSYYIWWDECKECKKPFEPEGPYSTSGKADIRVLQLQNKKLFPCIPENPYSHKGPCPSCWEPDQDWEQAVCKNCAIPLTKKCDSCKATIWLWWHNCNSCNHPNKFQLPSTSDEAFNTAQTRECSQNDTETTESCRTLCARSHN